jgi:hypothetical protein
MEQEIQKIDMKNDFRVCPACGYADGFQSMFKGQLIRWLLTCPSCHELYDIGLTARLEQT